MQASFAAAADAVVVAEGHAAAEDDSAASAAAADVRLEAGGYSCSCYVPSYSVADAVADDGSSWPLVGAY